MDEKDQLGIPDSGESPGKEPSGTAGVPWRKGGCPVRCDLKGDLSTPIQYISYNLQFIEQAFTCLEQLRKAYHELVREIGSSGMPLVEYRRFLELEKAEDIAFISQELPKAIRDCIEGMGLVKKCVLGEEEEDDRPPG